MSSSRHPVALRLEGYVGGEVELLATVMALPLVDGIFAALVLGGALSDPAGVLEVGLLIFGGSATLAVVLAEMRVPPRRGARAVALVGVVLVAGAAAEAALAPTIEGLVDVPRFERFAALVIAAIAATTASARIGEYLPSPGVIVGLGFLASVDPAGATVVVEPDPVLVGRAAGAAAVGTAFALGVALLAPRLRTVVDVDRFRFASAVALGLLALSILGMNLGQAPLLAVAVAGLLAYDPDGGDAAVTGTHDRADAGGPDRPAADAGGPDRTVADVGGSETARADTVASGGLADAATAATVADGGGGGSRQADQRGSDPGRADGHGPDAGRSARDGSDPDTTNGRDSDTDTTNGRGSDPDGGRSRVTDGERVPWL